MPWIQNVALSDVSKGFHYEPGVNAMLIQIVDPAMEFPTPLYQFRETHQFEFLDVEQDGLVHTAVGKAIDFSEFAITDEQAQQLVTLLKRALDHRMNVVVHCVAGVCRSGAVCEVGVMLGFSDPEVFRSPNLLVKHKMMRALGWTYDQDEPHTINNVAIDDEWSTPREKLATLATARREFNQREGDI